jgi:hypothetical protein
MMSPDERTRNSVDSGAQDNEENASATQPTSISGIDTAADLTYDEVYDVGTDTVGTSTDTTTSVNTTPVDMRAGYSRSGTSMTDRAPVGSIDGPYGDESMFATDSDGTPSADDQIGAMDGGDGGGGILSSND